LVKSICIGNVQALVEWTPTFQWPVWMAKDGTRS